MTFPHLEVESQLVADGFTVVLGVDEVGRGALAGPVCVGAVAWWPGVGDAPEGVRDSKLVSEKAREPLAKAIRQWCPLVAVGHAAPSEIDGNGIVASLGRAAARAVGELLSRCATGTRPVVLLDGSHDWLTAFLDHPVPVVTRVKADRDCLSVSASSIVAKVERDALMRALALEHPGYGFESNKGYGSAAHLEALASRGVSPVHRRSFVHLERRHVATD